jgi:spermidine/putrescine transport system permease protein
MIKSNTAKPFSVYELPGFSSMAVLCFLMLYAPIFILVGYSFNAGSSLALWEGFSFQWYYSAWQNDKVL